MIKAGLKEKHLIRLSQNAKKGTKEEIEIKEEEGNNLVFHYFQLVNQVLQISVLLFLLSSAAVGQVTKDTTWKRSDFVENTDDFLSLKLNANNDVDRITISGFNDFIIRPNANIRNNLSLNYKWLTLGFTFVVPGLYGNNDEEKGKTKTNDFRLALNTDRWSFSYHFKLNEGYYIESPGSFVVPPGQEYILLPNVNTYFHRVYVGYILNSNFSLKSLITFTERMLQNSGSFIPFFKFTYFHLDVEDGSVVEERAHNHETILGTSYTHKFTFKKYWYAAVIGSAGIGYLRSDIKELAPVNEEVKIFNSAMMATQIGGAFGYNGNRVFGGINYNHFTNEALKQGDFYALDDKRNVWEVFIGYRIRTPKFLRKPLNWADEQKEKVIK
jgi:hypothetical protein